MALESQWSKRWRDLTQNGLARHCFVRCNPAVATSACVAFIRKHFCCPYRTISVLDD